MKTPKPLEIKAEKKCDYLKIREKRSRGDFLALAPGEVEEIKLMHRQHEDPGSHSPQPRAS